MSDDDIHKLEAGMRLIAHEAGNDPDFVVERLIKCIWLRGVFPHVAPESVKKLIMVTVERAINRGDFGIFARLGKVFQKSPPTTPDIDKIDLALIFYWDAPVPETNTPLKVYTDEQLSRIFNVSLDCARKRRQRMGYKKGGQK